MRTIIYFKYGYPEYPFYLENVTLKLDTVFVKHYTPNHMLASKDNTR